MNYLSELAKNYPKSGIRVMFDLASNYPDAINLSVGEPNFETPDYIKEAAIKSINRGETKYNPNAGLYEFRQIIADKYSKQFNSKYEPENVMVAVGGMEAIFLALAAIVNPGDEVIIPNPAYPNYCGTASILGGKIVRVPLYEEHGFVLQAEDLEKVITPKTKVLILNYPTNPLGAVLRKEEAEDLALVIKKHNLMVISDEVYEEIIYDDIHFSLSQVGEIKNQVLVVNSLSKTYAMTGWRVGYILGDKEIIGNMPKLQEGICSCLPPFIQKAGIAALTGPKRFVDEMVVDYRRRRDILFYGLNSIKGFNCLKSSGSFYAFVNIEYFGKTSEEFAVEILKEAKVVCVPGSAFGSMGEGYLRFSFASSDENLTEAVERIKIYIEANYS